MCRGRDQNRVHTRWLRRPYTARLGRPASHWVSCWNGSVGLASIADVAAALNVLTALISDEDQNAAFDIADVHHGAIRALAIVEHDGGTLIVTGGDDGASELST